jgi:hypothetical protein
MFAQFCHQIRHINFWQGFGSQCDSQGGSFGDYAVTHGEVLIVMDEGKYKKGEEERDKNSSSCFTLSPSPIVMP